ncbi:hypothetical protein Ancab_020923 [Ancistrocladus abbreviatus]
MGTSSKPGTSFQILFGSLNKLTVSQAMTNSQAEFPGFQIFVPKDEYVPIRRPLSRLQRRAPCPLQLKSSSFKCEGASPKPMASDRDLSSSTSPPPSSSSLYASFYQNKDPIPLLSPLVSPSFTEPSYACENSTAKSH